MLKTSDKNTSKIWRITKNITKRKKQENQFQHQHINENSYTKPIEIVNELNIHFTNIGLQTCTKK